MCAAESDEEEKEYFLQWTEKVAACDRSGCLMEVMKITSSLKLGFKMLVMLMKMKASSKHARRQPHVCDPSIILVTHLGMAHEARAHV